MENKIPTYWGSYKRLLRSNNHENWRKGVCFIRSLHNVLVSIPSVLDCSFEMVDHSLYSPDLTASDYHLSCNMKSHLSRKIAFTIDHIYCWLLFLTNMTRPSPLMRWKHWKTDGRDVWTATGSMSQNKCHLVTLHESFMVSLYTFQPIIVNVKIGVQICFYKIDIQSSI